MLRRLVLRIAFVALVGAVDLPSGTVRGEDGTPADIAALVEQLGHAEFALREEASAELTRIGLPARKALEAAQEHRDREVRYRSRRVLFLVEELDFKRRLEAFAAHQDSAEDYDLPAWNAYRKLVGEGPAERELFVEMQQGDHFALRAIEKGPKEAAHMIEQRAAELQMAARYNGNQIKLGNIAVILLLASDKNVAVSPQAGAGMYSFCYQAAFRSEITGGKKKDALRTLLGAWIARADDATSYQSLHLAMQYDLSQGLTPAEKMLAGNAAQPAYTQYAILTIAKLGNKEHLAVLETKLTDKSLVSRPRINRKTYETQICDVALAALIHLSGEKHADYGFDRLQPNPQFLFNTSTLGFENDEERQKALAKWQAFRKKSGA